MVLAAGASRRLGRPKQLLDLGGRALLCWALDAARGFAPLHTVLVLGHESATIRQAIDLRDMTVVVNERHAEGMSTSLIVGLSALGGIVERAVILTGDQPFVSAEHLRALAAAHERTGKPIIATRYAEHAGVPLLLSRDAWPLVDTLSGDQGARPLLREHPDMVAVVAAGSDLLELDVDTWDSYARAQAVLAARAR